MLKNEKKTNKPKKKMGDRNHFWAEAIKHNALFYGREVAIGKVCKTGICSTCGNDEYKTSLKWKIVTNKGKKCTVLEEYPLNCDVETAFGKYGLPKDFIEVFGYWKDGEAIKPMKVE
jgi:hypothetical protein